MSRTRPQETRFEVFRWHSDSGFQVGEHGRFGAKFESLDGAESFRVESAVPDSRLRFLILMSLFLVQSHVLGIKFSHSIACLSLI